MGSKSGTPAVTICMTVRNEEKFIKRALDSLLSQTFPDFELIISDSVSTDRTGEICKEYAKVDNRIKYERLDTNVSPTADIRRLLQMARGRYVMIAPGDDWWEKGFINTLVNELDNHPEAGLAMSALHRYMEDGKYLDSMCFQSDDKKNPNNMAYLEMLIESATNIAANRIPYVLLLLGLYRTEILKLIMSTPIPEVPASDRLLLCHVAIATKIRYVNEFLFVKTIHHQPLRVRHAHNEYIIIHNTDRLAYTRTWLAFEPYLWASQAIPPHRKYLIPVASEVFMKTNWDLLYRQDVQTSLKYKGMEYTTSISEDIKAIEYFKKNGSLLKAHEFASALALNHPDYADLLINLAGIKYKMGNKKNAIGIFEDILKDCPENDMALNNLTIGLWNTGKKEDAVKLLKDRFDNCKDDITISLNLAKMTLSMGNFKEGLDYLDNAIKLEPDNSEALKLAGITHFNMGKFRAALDLLKRACKLCPDDEEIKKLIFQIENDKVKMEAEV